MKWSLALVSTLALAASVASSAAAQQAQPAPTAQQYLELLRQDLKTTKVAVLTEAMHLTPAESDKFWPAYREYDVALAKIYDNRLAIIKDYAKAYATMTDETAKALIERSFKNERARADLRQKTFASMSKTLSPVVAARFIQIENQLGMLIDLQIASELPLVEKP